MLKPSEDARGQPLIGATAKVAGRSFWIALSALDADVQSNLSLLKDRDWIDLPLVYDTGQRAILTFEKGIPGDRALSQAMTAWARPAIAAIPKRACRRAASLRLFARSEGCSFAS